MMGKKLQGQIFKYINKCPSQILKLYNNHEYTLLKQVYSCARQKTAQFFCWPGQSGLRTGKLVELGVRKLRGRSVAGMFEDRITGVVVTSCSMHSFGIPNQVTTKFFYHI
jgi:hypothetical protein